MMKIRFYWGLQVWWALLLVAFLSVFPPPFVDSEPFDCSIYQNQEECNLHQVGKEICTWCLDQNACLDDCNNGDSDHATDVTEESNESVSMDSNATEVTEESNSDGTEDSVFTEESEDGTGSTGNSSATEESNDGTGSTGNSTDSSDGSEEDSDGSTDGSGVGSSVECHFHDDQDVCTEEGCVWCPPTMEPIEEEGLGGGGGLDRIATTTGFCREDVRQCNEESIGGGGGGGDGSVCNRVPDEAECNATSIIISPPVGGPPPGRPPADGNNNGTRADTTLSCFWCGEVCRPSEFECPGFGGGNNNTVGIPGGSINGTIGIPGEGEGGDEATVCGRVPLEDLCNLTTSPDTGLPCFWCTGGGTEGGNCLNSESDCVGDTASPVEGGGNCTALLNERECNADSCYWCVDLATCIESDQDCPGEEGGGGNCTALLNERECKSSSCYWCMLDEICSESIFDCPGIFLCSELRNETECTDAACNWCTDICIEPEFDCPVDGGLCLDFIDETECTAGGDCYWCADSDSCLESEWDCHGDGGSFCSALVNETECAASSCYWCGESEDCLETEWDCHGSGGLCFEFGNETECTSNSCYWCADIEDCRESELDCLGEGGVCGDLQDQSECSSGSCYWCADSESCLESESDCSGDDGGGICSDLQNQTECSAGSCYWCSDLELCFESELDCPGDGGGGVCSDLRNQTECSAGLCIWCFDTGTCHDPEYNCPGDIGNNGTMKVCTDLEEMSSCSDREDCFWCEVSSLCRRTEEECPGQGRGNPCIELEGEECSSMEGCLWCEEQLCTSNRGSGQCPVTASNRTSCPDVVEANLCQSNIECRWCENDFTCKNTQDPCSDGSTGVRGNPCEAATSEELCPSGCVWCTEKSECQKPSDRACFGDDSSGGSETKTCLHLDAAPECTENSECQWCEAQKRCKTLQESCGDSMGEAGFEVKDVGAGMVIQDDGLGPTDPDAVSLSLEYIIEVAEDGSDIGPSFLDIANAGFEITQTVGKFFGPSTVTSQRIGFEGTIDGVGKIEMVAFVMLESGTITTEADSWSVEKGDLKFNIQMSGWNFCGPDNPCGGSDAISEFVDVAVKIKGSNESPETTEGSDLMFILGGNIPLVLSNEIVANDFLQEMPEGFPRAESTTEQGTNFIFRFPRFDDSVLYDPVIGFHESLIVVESPTPAPTNPPITTSVTSAPSAEPSPAPINEEKKNDPEDEEKDDGSNGGAIAGGIIGGILGLCCCCALVGMAMKRNETNQDAHDGDGILLPKDTDDDVDYPEIEEGMANNTSGSNDDEDDGEDDDSEDDDEEDSEDDESDDDEDDETDDSDDEYDDEGN